MALANVAQLFLTLIGVAAAVYAAACARAAARGADNAARSAQAGLHLTRRVHASVGRIHASLDALALLFVSRAHAEQLERASDAGPPSSTRRR